MRTASRLALLVVAAGLLHCSPAADGTASAEDALAQELRASAPGMTVYVRAQASTSRGSVTLYGRASKNLRAVSASTFEGSAGVITMTGPRRFELRAQSEAELARLLSGAPIELTLEASVGQIQSYVARVRLEAGYQSFSGSRSIFVQTAIAPVSVDGQLALRSRFRAPADASGASVSTPERGPVAPIAISRGEYRFDLSPSELVSAADAASDRVTFLASGTKHATIALTFAGVELSTADRPFPALECADATRSCLAGATNDLASCGTYAQVASCARVSPTACDPNLESALADCVYTTIEGFRSDPDRGPIHAVEALELCTREGDLYGPMFDGLCDFAPQAPYCACRGEETCLEDFVVQHLLSCGEQARPRFDCALGLSYRDIRSPLRTLVVSERRTLRVSDVRDSLEGAQVLAAVRQSRRDVQTIEEAFASVDRGQVERIDFWEGTNGVPYTSFEFGAGDNSYGAVLAFGTSELRARIRDSDLYDASPEANIGCRIPLGPRWNRCSDPAECATGHTCEGRVWQSDEESGESWVTAPGKCVARGEGADPREGNTCNAALPCPLGSALMCSALASGEDGLCRPTWMFGTFSLGEPLEIPAFGLAQHPVVVSGLATVPEAGHFEGYVSFSDFTRLRLSMANPQYNTTITFFDGPALGRAGVTALLGATSGELRVSLPFRVPGDESVNGQWLLVVDTRAGRSSSSRVPSYIVGGPSITLSSRYD